ncbi:MAG: DUF2339 domain-containing protein [Bacteroidota bacterium]|jgi:uncharacterized membrane protein
MAAFGFLLTTLISLIPLIASFVVLMRIRTMKRRADLHEAIIADLSRRVAELSSDEKPAQTPTFEHSATVDAAPVDAAPVVSPPGVIPPPPQHHVQSQRELEMVFGGTWLTRIGAVAIVLGTVFFLKYAFDVGLINETMRVIIGAVVGLGLIIGAERWRARGLHLFAQGLAGAGIPILYLSVYASYNFYQLLPQPMAFGLMCFVTAIAVGVSLRHNSVVIATLGALGGVCTPYWLSTGEMNTVGLFGYLLVLFIGMLWLNYRRPAWLSVSATAHAGVWAFWWYWMSVRSSMPDPDVIEATVLALTFLCAGVLYQSMIERDGNVRPYALIARALHGVHIVMMYFMTLGAVNTDIAWENGATAGLLGVALIVIAVLFRRDQHSETASLYMVLGLLALDHAISFIHGTYNQSIGLAALCLASMYLLGNRRHKAEMVVMGLMLFQSLVMALPEAAFRSFPTVSLAPFLNGRSAALIINAAAVIAWSGFASASLRLPAINQTLVSVSGHLILVWCIHLEVFSLTANTDLVVYPMISAVESWPTAFAHALASMVSVLLCCLMVLWQRVTGRQDVVIAGIAGSVFACLWWLTHVAVSEDPSMIPAYVNVRMFSGMIICAALIVTARRAVASETPLVARHASSIIGACLVIFSFTFITIEVVWPEVIAIESAAAYDKTSELVDAWDRFHLRMSATWIAYSIVLMIIGFARRMRPTRIAALILLLVTIGKVFLYDLSFLQQPYRIVSFIALGVILLAAGFMYQRFKSIIFEDAT